MLKTVALFYIFLSKPSFFQDSLNCIYLKKYIFCNVINIFTVTVDQFNAYLLNKSINLFEKNLTFPRLLNGSVS